jgi:integrase/recombinase XerD
LEWLHSRQARGVSPATLSLYRYTVRDLFGGWCRAQGITAPHELTTRHIERFSFHLLQRVSPVSAQSYLRTVGYFLGWLKTSELIERVPVIPKVRVPVEPKTPLDADDMQRLIEAGATERDRLMLELLCRSGMRASELCRLRVGDVIRQGPRHFCEVQGKGARNRLVPISPPLFRRLTTWARSSRPDAATDRLFISERRDFRLDDYAPLTRTGVRDVVKRAARRARLPETTTTHLLRHSWATDVILRGLPEQAIEQVGGWTDGRMLREHYAHITANAAHDAMMRLERAAAL